jgi:homoserine kinase type II
MMVITIAEGRRVHRGNDMHKVLDPAAAPAFSFGFSKVGNRHVGNTRTAHSLREEERAPRSSSPRMDATKVDMDEAKLALSMFIDDPDAKITATDGGANNIVQYVDTSDGKRFVLRIYNNGMDSGRVTYEHSVLGKIDTSNLPFQIPEYVPSLKTGKTMMELPSGTQSCLCKLIPGSLPKTSDPKPLGFATGSIMNALGKVDASTVEGEPCEAYYEIYQAHHSMNREKFYDYLKGPELDVCRESIDKMVVEFKILDDFIEEYLAKDLPQQLTHGDLHYDNVLVDDDGGVTGLLDFEFTSMDWRATEVAVCLSKYVGEEDPFPLVERFLEGVADAGVKLTADECRALPYMINLRVMSNVVYFVGRASAGEDSIEALTKRADMYSDRIVWVRENRASIAESCASKMGVSLVGPRPLHKKFTVAKATEEQLKEMDVANWPTWSTKGNAKYAVGQTAPLKVYDTNELSYIISGKMEIIPEETGEPVLVQAGDFVTFPEGFPCQWRVLEEINKHWFCYNEDGSPDMDD